jgi:2-deoxy-D-gluconate 3-dehydrogenase
MKLKDRIALVTGGGSGLGRAISLLFAEEGAHVIVNELRLEAAEQTVASMKGPAGGRAIQADVADSTQVKAMFATVEREVGGLDILVNNAGTNVRKQPQDYTLADWHHVLDTNLTSAFLCSRAAYAPMKAAGGGKIINIGSMMSIFGVSFSPAYGPSKGGIVQLTKSLATAWAKDNIQVNAVLPGWIDTDLTRGARRQVPELHDNVLRRTPAGRWGTLEDMAGVAVFLASGASDFVTGTAIPVDGGYSVLG